MSEKYSAEWWEKVSRSRSTWDENSSNSNLPIIDGSRKALPGVSSLPPTRPTGSIQSGKPRRRRGEQRDSNARSS
jgi:hypothetical protein